MQMSHRFCNIHTNGEGPRSDRSTCEPIIYGQQKEENIHNNDDCLLLLLLLWLLLLLLLLLLLFQIDR